MSEYIVSSEDLNQLQEVDDYSIRVTYRPTDLIVHQQINGEYYDIARIETLRKKHSSYYYFIVSFSKNSAEALDPADGLAKYSAFVHTLSFRMRDYVMLTNTQRDTIDVADFMLDRTYRLSRSTDVLFVFPRQKVGSSEWIELTIKDFGLGTGLLRFRFFRRQIDRVPTINFLNAMPTSMTIGVSDAKSYNLNVATLLQLHYDQKVYPA